MKHNAIELTTKHTGKMSGMQSLSTSCTINPRCIERVNRNDPECICTKCYAESMMSKYKNLESKTIRNARELATRLITDDEIAALPITSDYFRFEAFGDVINARHALNYRNIAAGHPATPCALWSKNYDIIAPVIAEYGKPANLRLIRSIEKINPSEEELIAALNEYDCIDAVFAVYTDDYIEAHSIEINCGALHCLTCHRCYTGSERIIRERLKKR